VLFGGVAHTAGSGCVDVALQIACLGLAPPEADQRGMGPLGRTARSGQAITSSRALRYRLPRGRGGRENRRSQKVGGELAQIHRGA